MHVRDWCAIAGLAYGVLSDSLGANKKVKENSLVGLVVGKAKKLMGYEPREEYEEKTLVTKVPCAALIQLAHQKKKRLLEEPGVESVQAALVNGQIVLTVVRSES